MAEGYRGEGWNRTGPTGMVCVWWWECIGNEIMWELMDGGADRRHFPSSFTTQPNNPTKVPQSVPTMPSAWLHHKTVLPTGFPCASSQGEPWGRESPCNLPFSSQNISIYTDSLEALKEHNAHTERETLLPTCTHIPCCIHIQT